MLDIRECYIFIAGGYWLCHGRTNIRELNGILFIAGELLSVVGIILRVLVLLFEAIV